MRRRFKPNLGGRTGPRSTETAPKPSPGVAQRPPPLTTPTPDTTPQPPQPTTPTGAADKPDPFTQLKASEKDSDVSAFGSVESISANELSVPAAPASSFSALSPKAAPGLRSPKKAVIHEGPKSPGAFCAGHSNVTVAPSLSQPSIGLAAARPRSPRKSISSEHGEATGKLLNVASGEAKEAENSHSSGPGSPVKNASTSAVNSAPGGSDSSPTKKGSAPAVKPAVKRRSRARFTPNMVGLGKNLKIKPVAPEPETGKPATPSQKTPEPEIGKPTTLYQKAPDQEISQGQSEGEGQNWQPSPEVSMTKESIVVVSQPPESSCASEAHTEEAQAAESALTDQPQPADVGSLSVDQVDARHKNGDSESDAGTADSSSVTTGPGNDLGELSAEVDNTFAVPDSRKVKKVRRGKQFLPSTEKTSDRTKMKVGDFLYFNPSGNAMTKKASSSRVIKQPAMVEELPAEGDTGDDETSDLEPEPIIQLTLDDKNQIVLNEDSMVVKDRSKEAKFLTETVEEDGDRYSNCRSYRRRDQRSMRWSEDDTRRFYHALSVVGTDFTMMAKLFTKRSRDDLKRKFTKEDKLNRSKVDKALRERQAMKQSVIDKAREEDEAESQRQKAKEEEKKRKKMEKQKIKEQEKQALEQEEEEEMEGDEEEMEKQMEAEEREERKENKRKRGQGKLCKDGGKFAGYKKGRFEQPRAGHNQEVAEILATMSQVGTADRNQATADDNMSDTSSVVSDLDSTVSSSPFVPRFARTVKQPRPSTSCHVVIDPEVSVPQWTVPDSGEAEAGTIPTQTAAQEVEASQTNSVSGVTQEGIASTSQNVIGDSSQGTSSAAVSLQDVVAGSSMAASSVALETDQGVTWISTDQATVDLELLIQELQARATSPVELLCVEQTDEGGHGKVSIYLVPHNPAPQQGGEMNSSQGGDRSSVQPVDGALNSTGATGFTIQSKGIAGNTVLTEGDVGNSLLTQGGNQNSLLTQAGVQNSVLTQAGIRNSVLTQAGVQNSLLTQAGVQNSLLTQAGVQNSLLTQAGVQNSLLTQTGVQNSLLTQASVQNSLLTQAGVQKSLLTQAGVQNSLLTQAGAGKSLLTQAVAGNTLLSQVGQASLNNTGAAGFTIVREGGVGNSLLAQGGVGNSLLAQGGVENNLLTEGGAQIVMMTERGVGNSPLRQGGVQNSLLTERGAGNSQLAHGDAQIILLTEEDAGNSLLTQGGVGNSLLTQGGVSSSILTGGVSGNSALTDDDARRRLLSELLESSLSTEGGADSSLLS